MIDHGKCTKLLYTEPQIRDWLSCLARGMKQHGQTVFMLEQLQPSWLPTHGQRWMYLLGSRAIGGLLVGFIVTLSLALGTEFRRELLPQVAPGLIRGLLGGLCVGIIDGWRYTQSGFSRENATLRSNLHLVLNVFVIGIAAGTMTDLLDLSHMASPPVYPIQTLFAIATAAIAFGLIFGFRSSQRSFSNDIQLVESFQWSWKSVRENSLNSLVTGLGAGLMVGIGVYIADESPAMIVMCGLVLGLSVTAFHLFINGLRGAVVDMKACPNQGIKLTLAYALRGCFMLGLFVGSVAEVCFMVLAPYVRPNLSRPSSLECLALFAYAALFSGICAGLWYGFLDVIQHYTLRLILFATGRAPLGYIRFLNYSADKLKFLQKVGGSYIFIHRILLEHFAAMEVRGKPDPQGALAAQ